MKFIEYNRQCNRGDCTRNKIFKFSIEVFDPTGEYLLENQENFNYMCVRCKTKKTANFFIKKTMNKMMGIKELRQVYLNCSFLFP